MGEVRNAELYRKTDADWDFFPVCTFDGGIFPCPADAVESVGGLAVLAALAGGTLLGIWQALSVQFQIELLEYAGVRHPENWMGRYPFELSGGQCQCVVLAIALASKPDLLIADEPTTALDVTVQRKILERLKRIAEETNMALLVVSHDFGVIASLAERVLVMKAGEIVEEGSLENLFYSPKHPETKELVEHAKATHRFLKRQNSGANLLCVDGISRLYRKRRIVARRRLQKPSVETI